MQVPAGGFAALLHLQEEEPAIPFAGSFMLNRELSDSLLCRLSLAIVLSPGNYPQDNFRPPEGATFLEPCACTTRCFYPLIPAFSSTVSAPMSYVHRLNLQLSINEPAISCRFPQAALPPYYISKKRNPQFHLRVPLCLTAN